MLENRCRPVSLLSSESWCPAGDIQNPKSNRKLVESKDFNDTVGHVVQLKPQKYHLDVRVGQPIPFNFTYKMADNFPLTYIFCWTCLSPWNKSETICWNRAKIYIKLWVILPMMYIWDWARSLTKIWYRIKSKLKIYYLFKLSYRGKYLFDEKEIGT